MAKGVGVEGGALEDCQVSGSVSNGGLKVFEAGHQGRWSAWFCSWIHGLLEDRMAGSDG